ncbi:MAG: lipoprotein insertase outer membrane protein LolB [Xanthomonadales bacterium]|nr:lipoprotein insertase outer membrane protein LolB [Xanthomonadales bacterium]
MTSCWRLAVAAVTCLAIAGCAQTPRRSGEGWMPVAGIAPDAVDAFRVSGRLAVSDGREGGSAGFLWLQRGEAFEVELRQPVSQRTWRLVGDARGAVLHGGEGGPRRGHDAQTLLHDVLGWHLPVRALVDWVRGLPGADAPIERLQRDDRGRVQLLVQAGWQVEYRGWLDDGAWPTRIQARQGSHSVRLNVQDWAVARD